MKLGLAIINDLPHFVAKITYSKLRDAFGATQTANNTLWALPAYPPFKDRALRDITTVAGSEPIEYTKTLQEWLDKEASINYAPITSFYGHQRTAFEQLANNPRWGLFYDRGLGKTKIALDYIRYRLLNNNKFKTLVLVKAVNLHTWVNEAALHASDVINPVTLEATTSVPVAIKKEFSELKNKVLEEHEDYKKEHPRTSEKVLGARLEKKLKALPSLASFTAGKRLEKIEKANFNLIVIPYDTAKAYEDQILNHLSYHCVICDESHSLRGGKSLRTKAIINIAAKASYRYLLTGTPSLGDPRHFWGQLKLLHQDLVPSFFQFSQQHLVFAPENNHIITGYKNMKALNNLVTGVSHALKAEDCLDLPDRVFSSIEIDPPTSIKNIYNGIVEDGLADINGRILSVPEKVTRLEKLSQIASGLVYFDNKDPTICDTCPNVNTCVENSIKPYTTACQVVKEAPPVETIRLVNPNPIVEQACELVEELIAEGKKIIVWAYHKEMLNWLVEELTEVVSKIDPCYKVIEYTSRTKDLAAAEHTFNTDPDAKVIVGQITMGIGVTFKAPVMIYAEVKFSLDSWLQSLDRNWGIRAKGFSKMLVILLYLRGSVYGSAMKLLQKKIDISNIMITSPGCVTCPKFEDCLANNIKPFDPACVYDSKVSKTGIPFKPME